MPSVIVKALLVTSAGSITVNGVASDMEVIAASIKLAEDGQSTPLPVSQQL